MRLRRVKYRSVRGGDEAVGEDEGAHFAGAVQYCTPGEILKEQAMNDGTEV